MNDKTTTAAQDEQFRKDFGLSGIRKPVPTFPGFVPYVPGAKISAPGAYRGVPMAVYHGEEPCDSPSISSTGLKILAAEKGARKKGQTPRHYFEGSHLNPKRKPKRDTDALRLGRAFHDCLLDPEAWDRDYHVLPEGFSRAASVKQAAAIAEADAAIADGLTVLTIKEVERTYAYCDAIQADPLILPFLSNGEAEVTFAWKDEATGVWCRARPDWMLADLSAGINFKTDADASWSGFSTSIAKFGYAQSAAFELDGYLAVFGEAPRRYLHPVVEKVGEGYEAGDWIPTALWELPDEDIERGRWLNRIALNRFAECLSSGKWPGYNDGEPELCGLPSYARHVIDNGGAAEPADDEINA